jgi:hypothetical protein
VAGAWSWPPLCSVATECPLQPRAIHVQDQCICFLSSLIKIVTVTTFSFWLPKRLTFLVNRLNRCSWSVAMSFLACYCCCYWWLPRNGSPDQETKKQRPTGWGEARCPQSELSRPPWRKQKIDEAGCQGTRVQRCTPVSKCVTCTFGSFSGPCARALQAQICYSCREGHKLCQCVCMVSR